MKLFKNISYFLLLVFISTSSSALTTWKTVLPQATSNSYEGIIWNGTQYIGVTKGGTVFSSADLSTLTSKTISQRNLTDIAFNGTQYVVIGEFGSVFTSSDGSNWSSVNSATTKNLTSIVWTGSLWVAVGTGGVIITSSDGTSWTSRTSGTTGALHSVASSGSLILTSTKSTSATGAVLSSADGVTWTTATTVNIKSIVWNGTQFVGLTFNGRATTTSSDGITWVDQAAFPTLGSSGTAEALFWNGAEYLAKGSVAFNSQAIYVGTDLQTWTTSGLKEINDVASKGGSQWVVTQAFGQIKETQDNVTWTSKGNDPTALHHLNDVIYANNQFIAVGESGTILTSSDGTAWTSQTSGTTEDLRAIAWSGTQYITVARGTGFGAAANAVVLTSPDGITWTNLNVGFVATLQSVAANGNTIVIGSTNTLFTSTDNGVSWPTSVAGGATDIVWNGTQFSYATGAFNKPSRIIWDGTQFVGIGGSNAKVFTSADGSTWANISSSKLPFSWNNIISVNGTYIAVSSGTGQIFRSAWDTFQSSMIANLGTAASPASITEEISGQGDSGQVWSSTTKPTFGTNWGLSSLASDGTIVIAVGTDSTILSRTAPSSSVFTACSAGIGFGSVNVTGSAASRVRSCYVPTSGVGNSNDDNFTWLAPNVAPIGLSVPEWEIKLSASLIAITAGLDRWTATSLTGFAGLGVSVDSVNKTVTFNQSTINGSGGALILEGTMSYSVVVDAIKPVIALSGAASITVNQNTTYTDLGATATDDTDGNVTAQIVTTNPVDTSTAGTYTVRYNVSDAAGNTATEVTRTVIVQAVSIADTVKPVITLTGASSITIDQNTTYTDLGATATDNVDGNLTAQITTTNPVVTATLGTYTVRYNVTDAAGNTATEVTRTVIVQDASSGSTGGSSSGGGSFNLWFLLTLVSLGLVYRRKK